MLHIRIHVLQLACKVLRACLMVGPLKLYSANCSSHKGTPDILSSSPLSDIRRQKSFLEIVQATLLFFRAVDMLTLPDDRASESEKQSSWPEAVGAVGSHREQPHHQCLSSQEQEPFRVHSKGKTLKHLHLVLFYSLSSLILKVFDES